ncbi:MAG: hypothetical protein JSS97_12195 [Actinobacteria bacterium]|nr:hypothetical protein [Actinomycetota bacterium]
MPADTAEWRPLIELRHRVDQMFRDIAGEGVLEVTIPLPKEESKQVVEIKPRADGASTNGG